MVAVNGVEYSLASEKGGSIVNVDGGFKPEVPYANAGNSQKALGGGGLNGAWADYVRQIGGDKLLRRAREKLQQAKLEEGDILLVDFDQLAAEETKIKLIPSPDNKPYRKMVYSYSPDFQQRLRLILHDNKSYTTNEVLLRKVKTEMMEFGRKFRRSLAKNKPPITEIILPAYSAGIFAGNVGVDNKGIDPDLINLCMVAGFLEEDGKINENDEKLKSVYLTTRSLLKAVEQLAGKEVEEVSDIINQKIAQLVASGQSAAPVSSSYSRFGTVRTGSTVVGDAILTPVSRPTDTEQAKPASAKHISLNNPRESGINARIIYPVNELEWKKVVQEGKEYSQSRAQMLSDHLIHVTEITAGWNLQEGIPPEIKDDIVKREAKKIGEVFSRGVLLMALQEVTSDDQFKGLDNNIKCQRQKGGGGERATLWNENELQLITNPAGFNIPQALKELAQVKGGEPQILFFKKKNDPQKDEVICHVNMHVAIRETVTNDLIAKAVEELQVQCEKKKMALVVQGDFNHSVKQIGNAVKNTDLHFLHSNVSTHIKSDLAGKAAFGFGANSGTGIYDEESSSIDGAIFNGKFLQIVRNVHEKRIADEPRLRKENKENLRKEFLQLARDKEKDASARVVVLKKLIENLKKLHPDNETLKEFQDERLHDSGEFLLPLLQELGSSAIEVKNIITTTPIDSGEVSQKEEKENHVIFNVPFRDADRDINTTLQSLSNESEVDIDSGKRRTKTELKVKPDDKEIVFSISRPRDNQNKDVELNNITLNSEGGTQEYQLTSFILYKNSHYLAYIQEKDGKWYCYDDAKKAEVQGEALQEAKKRANIVKYSKCKDGQPLELPDAQKGTNNIGNTCWANAALAFALSFTSIQSALEKQFEGQDLGAEERARDSAAAAALRKGRAEEEAIARRAEEEAAAQRAAGEASGAASQVRNIQQSQHSQQPQQLQHSQQPQQLQHSQQPSLGNTSSNQIPVRRIDDSGDNNSYIIAQPTGYGNNFSLKMTKRVSQRNPNGMLITKVCVDDQGNSIEGDIVLSADNPIIDRTHQKEGKLGINDVEFRRAALQYYFEGKEDSQGRKKTEEKFKKETGSELGKSTPKTLVHVTQAVNLARILAAQNKSGSNGR